MRLLPVVFASFVVMSPALADAGEIVWRSPTSGTLTFVQPPPELESDPTPSADFGITYGAAIKVRPGTPLSFNPLWPSGLPQTGYMFSSPDLPAALSLDLSNGIIRGRIFDAHRYEFSVTISNAAGQSQIVPVAILVE